MTRMPRKARAKRIIRKSRKKPLLQRRSSFVFFFLNGFGFLTFFGVFLDFSSVSLSILVLVFYYLLFFVHYCVSPEF